MRSQEGAHRRLDQGIGEGHVMVVDRSALVLLRDVDSDIAVLIIKHHIPRTSLLDNVTLVLGAP
jgi:hypothetical protein